MELPGLSEEDKLIIKECPIIKLFFCELNHLKLNEGVLYKLERDPNCKKCMEY
jgi:hypothetical protein